MKKYKVVDWLCGAVTYYDDIKETNREAFNVQGALIKVENGKEEILKDYSGFLGDENRNYLQNK